ncbi:MAG: HEAT repeat domain-containing protein [Pseudomonadota bacterium]
MPFAKGESGNPGGRAKVKLKDGRTLTDLAREHTVDALKVLVEVMRDKQQPGTARVAAADKVLNRGWGQAPQTIALTDDREPRDLSGLSDDQLEALETLRSLAPLAEGVAGSC